MGQKSKTKLRSRPAIISDVHVSRSRALINATLAFIVVVLIWQIAVLIFPRFGALFPAPYEVLVFLVRSFWEPIGQLTLIPHLLWTIKRIFVGYFVGAALGIIVGLAMGTSKIIYAIIRPVFEIVRPIPAIAWIPMAILWFGTGELSKYFVVGFSTFVICALNSIAGARQASPVLKGAAKMLGASDRQVFSKVVLPSSVPQIFGGLQISLSANCSTILAAEMIRSEEGAGWMILRGMNTGNMTLVLVGLIVISVTGLALATIMRNIERRAISWHRRGR